ncbi:MAG: serine/threonine-protein phosphatase, partial [Bacteroidetes bacterium]|nr:serine/threonine-protein phosphatase [Bacteroidota bacterium]
FAAVDCTGHGVPGAVMSMLGISFLNDIVSIEGLLTPAEILNRLRDKIVKELRQTGGADGNKDGMDISLARLNLKTKELEWAGANNSLNLIRNGELGIVKADKQPIGYHPNSHPFTNHKIQLKKGDNIYLYSDGYADQFGGPKGKKFKYKQLDDLILTLKLLPMSRQKELLKKHFTDWKGSLEQVDDVCVFGVRI